MKSKITILAVLFFVLVLPASIFAQNNFQSGDIVTLSKEQVVNADYFGSGKSVVLDGTVEGDAYVAGGDITVNGGVKGDLLVAGGNVTVIGPVDGNIRALGGNINIMGTVGKNVSLLGGSITVSPNAQVMGSIVVAGGNINVLGKVDKAAVIAGGQVNIGGQIGGDITAGVGNLILAASSQVNGDILYWSENKANISKDSNVSGTVSQRIPPQKIQKVFEKNNVMPQKLGDGFIAFFKIISFLSSLIIGLLLLSLIPKFTTRVAHTASKNWLKSLGIGILMTAATPFILMILFVTMLGAPVAMFWLTFILFDMWMAKIFISVTIGMYAAKVFKQSWNSHITFSVGLVIYFVAGMIPILGLLVGFFATFIGLGALLITKKNYYEELRKKELI